MPSYLDIEKTNKSLSVGDRVRCGDNSGCLEFTRDGLKRGYCSRTDLSGLSTNVGKILAMGCDLPACFILGAGQSNDTIIEMDGKVFFTCAKFLSKA
jgi:hypothetical protein